MTLATAVKSPICVYYSPYILVAMLLVEINNGISLDEHVTKEIKFLNITNNLNVLL